MRFPDRAVPILLLAIGLVCVGGNVWVTWHRSGIPSDLNGIVTDKRIGREKHPGLDDVHWIELDGSETMHVDKALYETLYIGDTLVKESMSETLLVNDNLLVLSPSEDFEGMLLAMPLVLLLFILLSMAGYRRRSPG